MGTLIIHSVLLSTIITLLIVIIVTYKKNYESIRYWIKSYLSVIFASGFFYLVLFSVIYGVIQSSYQNNVENLVEKPYKTYELLSLNDNKNIDGSLSMMFFVGSGYIGENLYYYFYIKNSETGLIELKKERADREYNNDIYIKEIKKGEKPKYIKYGYFIKDNESIWYDPYLVRKTKSILYIPKGSILNEFKLDLE